MQSAADEHEALIQFLYLVPVGLVQADADGRIQMINPRAVQLLMPLSDDGGLDNQFTLLAGVAPQLRAAVAAHGGEAGVVCEGLRLPLAHGTAPQVLSLHLVKVDGQGLMAVLQDATADARREQQGLASRLNDAARLDSLTRMPNRAAVREHLQAALQRPRDGRSGGFAVLFLNCDRFKQINDGLGHACGDQLLGLMAERLRERLRRVDTVARRVDADTMPAVGRVGGDEFVLVADDLRGLDDVHALAQRLMQAMAQPYELGGRTLHCTFSMGIVMEAQAGGDADAVLQDASLAMVEAKRAGGARFVVFDPPMRARAALRGQIAADLRTALAEDQLFLVYQPVVAWRPDGTTDRSAGVEALVRWRHPVRGVVPPLEFIGVAEECGLIGALGDHVLRSACRQFVAWQRKLGERAPRLLAVNLSRAQLGRPGWLATVQQILQETGMDAQRLQLEVTESLAAQDEGVQARLHELKALRITLALDDFGTGYSSLASLHQLPVDTVKIDRSFVAKADISHHHRVLIEATLRVADSLGMATVAEGIETEAQAAVVRGLGCGKGQGYLFSRPLRAEELHAWLDIPPTP